MTAVSRKLELGCGNEKPQGFYGVDIKDTEATNIRFELEVVKDEV